MPASLRVSPRFFASIVVSALIASVLAFAPTAHAASPGPLVIGVDPFDNGGYGDRRGLQPFDATTGEAIGGHEIIVASAPVPLQGGTVNSANAISTDPVSGDTYAILDYAISSTNKRVLAKLNLTTGAADIIGDPGKKLAGLAFSAGGTLYAVSGRGNTACRGCLYIVNTSTAATGSSLFQFSAVVADEGGEAIAFGGDGMLYRGHGYSNYAPDPTIFQKLDVSTCPATCTATNIPLTGGEFDEPTGLGWDAANSRFIVTDIDEAVWSVTAAGAVTQLSTTRMQLRGVVVSASPVPADNPPTAANDTFGTSEDGWLSELDVIQNDTDADGGAEYITGFTQPANGRVDFRNSTQEYLRYIPNADYCNNAVPDEFSYTLNGGSTANVFVTVQCATFDGPLIYAVQNTNEDFSGERGFSPFDAANGQIEAERMITNGGGPVAGSVDGAKGLAIQPTTNTSFTVLNLDPSDLHVLATIDRRTGVATTLGEVDDLSNNNLDIAALAFNTNGTLYGVTSDIDATCPECLYSINTTSGDATKLRNLGAGGDGEALAFDPLNKRLYHMSGFVTGDPVFERIDPTNSFATTPIAVSGDSYFNPYSLAFDSNTGKFAMTDIGQTLYDVTTGGVVTTRTSIDQKQPTGIVVQPSKLTLRYSTTRRRFSGALTYPLDPECIGSRTVTIWKAVSGPDRVLTTLATDAGGTFVFRSRARGTFYATVPGESVATGIDCRATTSPPRRVR